MKFHRADYQKLINQIIRTVKHLNSDLSKQMVAPVSISWAAPAATWTLIKSCSSGFAVVEAETHWSLGSRRLPRLCERRAANTTFHHEQADKQKLPVDSQLTGFSALISHLWKKVFSIQKLWVNWATCEPSIAHIPLKRLIVYLEMVEWIATSNTDNLGPNWKAAAAQNTSAWCIFWAWGLSLIIIQLFDNYLTVSCISTMI